MPAPRHVKGKSAQREYLEAIVIAVVLALVVRTFVLQAFKIPSGSMIPTLLIGDHILVNKAVYWFRPVRRGDVIVFKYPADRRRDFIKRVVGLSGDRIEIRHKVVYINGEPLKEPYAHFTDEDDAQSPRDNFGPVMVPEEELFMMGDNRDNSSDSRYWGFLERDDVKGKAFLIYFSFNTNGGPWHWVRWPRLGDLIH